MRFTRAVEIAKDVVLRSTLLDDIVFILSLPTRNLEERARADAHLSSQLA